MRKDSLRIDSPSELPYEFAASVAEKLIGLIRWYTNQWWVKRGREHPRTHIRHWFHANELGERLGGVGLFAFFYGKLGFERSLDSAIWSDVIKALRQGQSIAVSNDIFLDAVYFHSADDLRRCILEVAISNEILLAETLARWAAQGRLESARIEKVLGGNDYLSHLSRAGNLWSRSFADEHPTEFEWIKAVWIARGNVGHGKRGIAHGNRELTLKDIPSVFASVIVLRQWLGVI